MSMGTLNMVAQSVSGTLVGSDRNFDSVSTDTRSLRSGQLFFALRGDRFDAEKFVVEAGRRGAAGAVVETRQAIDMPQIEVADTRVALGSLAASWRTNFNVPVIAVTGSTGKTTVKEMIAAVLHAHFGTDGKVLSTDGNLNNEIGLPLTVLRLRDEHAAAILEMGASRRGDIALLAGIAAPTIGMVTNAGAAHLEGFGSEQTVAETKGELFACLGVEAVAVINRDDPYFELWCQLAAPARIVSFGFDETADVVAGAVEETVTAQGFELSFDVREANDPVRIKLPMVGRHNVLNALGAIAVTRAAGASWESIKAGLAAIENVAGRLRTITGPGGVRVIDDTYNANPVSVAAAIRFLGGLEGRAWLVLGDMAELGDRSEALHAEMGRQAKAAGVERLYTVGELARTAVESFGDGGQAFAERDVLGSALDKALKSTAHSDLTVLVKGSRCMRMEKLVQALCGETANSGGRDS